MATIGEQELGRVARLARLELSADEEASYAAQLEAILGYAQRVGDVDTGGLAPAASVLRTAPPLAPDEPGPTLSVEAVLALAPDREGHRHRVPAVLAEPA